MCMADNLITFIRSLEMWEPQPPGTLTACPGLYRECFTFTLHSSASTVTRLLAGKSRNRALIPSRSRRFFLLQSVHKGSGFNQPPVRLVPWALSPEVKLLGNEADHSPTSSAMVKSDCNCNSIPPHTFMACTGTIFMWHSFRNNVLCQVYILGEAQGYDGFP